MKKGQKRDYNSPGMTGKKHSDLSNEKNRIAHKRENLPEATLKRMSEAQSKRVGSKSAAWKGGISKDKEYLSWLKNRHWYRQKNAIGSHTFGEWEKLKAQYNWTCPCCGKSEPEIKLTEDHIIPLSKGGSDNIENIQPLCGSCNSKKKTKVIKFL